MSNRHQEGLLLTCAPELRGMSMWKGQEAGTRKVQEQESADGLSLEGVTRSQKP